MCEYTYKLTFCDASCKTLSVQFTRFGFLHLPSESHNLVAVPYQKYREVRFQLKFDIFAKYMFEHKN